MLQERPPSSSHFRVSEQQRSDCLFSPSAPAGACSGLLQGRGDQAPLFHAVYHLALVRGAQLSCSATNQRGPLYLCQRCPATRAPQNSKKPIRAILTDITVRAVEAKLFITLLIDQWGARWLKIEISIDGSCQRLPDSFSKDFQVCSCTRQLHTSINVHTDTHKYIKKLRKSHIHIHFEQRHVDCAMPSSVHRQIITHNLHTKIFCKCSPHRLSPGLFLPSHVCIAWSDHGWVFHFQPTVVSHIQQSAHYTVAHNPNSPSIPV